MGGPNPIDLLSNKEAQPLIQPTTEENIFPARSTRAAAGTPKASPPEPPAAVPAVGTVRDGLGVVTWMDRLEWVL